VKVYCHRCEGLVEPGHKHRAKDHRLGARARGYDAEWSHTRKAYLDVFPMCMWPEGCTRHATQVHHLDGLGPKGPKGHDWGNLQGLCASHHSQVTATEQPGGFILDSGRGK
jgi:5-methylcytosine-specific restriction protein A